MKSFNHTMRSLHRDLGYFAIGLTLLYSLTGIILSGRSLSWFEVKFKQNTIMNKHISKETFNEAFIAHVLDNNLTNIFPQSSFNGVKKHLKLQLKEEKGDVLMFNAWRSLNVRYDSQKGNVFVTYQGYPIGVKLFVNAHKASHESAWFYLAIIYSVILSFLAISSFWMVKGKNGFKKRGVYLMLAGFLTIALFLFL